MKLGKLVGFGLVMGIMAGGAQPREANASVILVSVSQAAGSDAGQTGFSILAGLSATAFIVGMTQNRLWYPLLGVLVLDVNFSQGVESTLMKNYPFLDNREDVRVLSEEIVIRMNEKIGAGERNVMISIARPELESIFAGSSISEENLSILAHDFE